MSGPQVRYVVGDYDRLWGLYSAVLPKSTLRLLEREELSLPFFTNIDEIGNIEFPEFPAFDYCIFGRSEARARKRAMEIYGYVKVADADKGSLIPNGGYITMDEARRNRMIK